MAVLQWLLAVAKEDHQSWDDCARLTHLGGAACNPAAAVESTGAPWTPDRLVEVSRSSQHGCGICSLCSICRSNACLTISFQDNTTAARHQIHLQKCGPYFERKRRIGQMANATIVVRVKHHIMWRPCRELRLRSCMVSAFTEPM